MKRLFFTFSILIILAFSIFAQNPKPTPKGTKANLAKNNKLALKEKDDFEKARALANLDEKITALQKFAEDYPKSNDRITALEIVVSTRAQLGDEKLRAGENEAGLKFFKDAVTDAPVPMSEKLFAELEKQENTSAYILPYWKIAIAERNQNWEQLIQVNQKLLDLVLRDNYRDDLPAVYLNFAKAYFHLNQPQKALENLEKLLALTEEIRKSDDQNLSLGLFETFHTNSDSTNHADSCHSQFRVVAH